MIREEREPVTDDGRAMQIGEVAARTELSLRSLRHWDEVGLLRPSARTSGGFRLYTEADVDKILVIRRMKPLGFTLDQMSAAMRDIETLQSLGAGEAGEAGDGAGGGSDEAGAEARRRLAEILHEATDRRRRLTEQLAMADEFISLLGDRIEH